MELLGADFELLLQILADASDEDLDAVEHLLLSTIPAGLERDRTDSRPQ